MTRSAQRHSSGPLPIRAAAAMFLAFAFAYFLSALLRAVVATLAPTFSSELGLNAAQLGLLAGAYFLGFSVMQLPMGAVLDRYGPKRLLLAMLAIAVVGCAAFATAGGLAGLLGARLLIGVGVAGCLMAPLTAYRLHLGAQVQSRANAWMLMTGSLGMLASTSPVQWAIGLTGWRTLFWWAALALLAGMALIALWVPADRPSAQADRGAAGYRQILAEPLFRSVAPLGFTLYGGLVAMQTLWIGPWLNRVAGLDSAASAAGLFLVNASMLLAFLSWGWAAPRLARSGWSAQRVIGWCWPPCVLLLVAVVIAGERAGAAAWMLWCVCASAINLSQPAVGMAQPPALAGRALSAFNLVIFVGVFCIQWGIGLLADVAQAQGLSRGDALRVAMLALAAGILASGLWFRVRQR